MTSQERYLGNLGNLVAMHLDKKITEEEIASFLMSLLNKV